MRLTTGFKAAAALAAAALLVTGCSSSDDAGTGTDGSTGKASGEKVELTFWTWAPNMDKVVALWNAENPDIQVTVNKQDGGDPAVTKLLTAIKAGSGAPDIMQAEYQKIPTLVSSDALADISGEIPADVAAGFPEGIWNAVTLGSEAVYGVPQDSGPMQFYYRADVFENLGIAVPTTWDEYAAAAAAIHAADPNVYLGTFSATDAGWFTGLAQQAGASWWGIDGDAWTVSIDDTATEKVASYWGGLVEEGVINNKPMYTPEWNAALNNGTEVGWLSAVWAPGVLEGNAPDTQGKWKMAPMPQWDAAKPATGNWGGSATAVTSQSKHPAEAAEFITWLNTSQDAVNALVTESGIYPAYSPAQAGALAEPPAFFSNQPDFFEIAGETAKTAGSFTYGPNVNVAYSAYNDEFGKAAEAKSQAKFLDAVAAMQKVTLEDLKNSGFSVKE
ncbi:carbohydrate ABC transporter substrate-binding protein, CUT1 family [Sanguibacter gelidistatuariae]|uniref:Carbohydrate ABC transporter substrate-binding protein, CUT1 family n=1 Tax=Sanguibacter gelidistatuariae TaxID=1814289 RepID=A0A1G6NFC0_9MICO|nr:extracellular solute-binding protein [Sanguibacter gelidistatuariae]SDC66124.1 carbohydrate ABC transporter substrate-binding protein, CUT1 family [Sanguibacter gelidistatuariae]